MISWGSNATGRGANCPASANCRNLSYTLVGDFGPGPYILECLGEGHDPWKGRWSGSASTGCYYRGTGHTVYVVIDGVRSNDLVGPPAADGTEKQVRISWGSNATGRGANCPASANCRNLSYTLVGDFGPGPYILECLGEGHDPWKGRWSGSASTGCYYRGTGHTVYVVIDGVRSNDLVGPPAADGTEKQVRISWGSNATGRGANCPASANCRNLSYTLVGDFGPGPYILECLGEGHDPWKGRWSGSASTGCYYRGTGHTVYVVIDGVRSNDLQKQ